MMSAFSYTMHGYRFVYSLYYCKHKKKASQNMLLHACDASHFIHL